MVKTLMESCKRWRSVTISCLCVCASIVNRVQQKMQLYTPKTSRQASKREKNGRLSGRVQDVSWAKQRNRFEAQTQFIFLNRGMQQKKENKRPFGKQTSLTRCAWCIRETTEKSSSLADRWFELVFFGWTSFKKHRQQIVETRWKTSANLFL